MTVVITETVVKVVKVDWDALAKAVKNEVMTKLKNDLVMWEDDASMLSMVLMDASSGIDAAVLLADGDWKGAEQHLYDMDTAPREYVYDWIEKHSCVNLFQVLGEQAA
jgi:hypothetical protein